MLIQLTQQRFHIISPFIRLYNNLPGLELIKPCFEVSINGLIPTLDFLSIDIEYLNDRIY